jgi:rfaE bifunctional protein nucleotidyltransferase chain/domain
LKTLFQHKISTLDDLLLLISRWRSADKSVVFTNGCFDIIHLGHIDYLHKAAALGDYLIVGVNGDASTRRLKGAHRPIQHEISRSSVMAALGCVDAVILFNEDTPESLIQGIKPDVLVKGGDWPLDKIVGSSFVQSYGGLVTTIPFIDGYSTTLIEQKIRQLQ